MEFEMLLKRVEPKLKAISRKVRSRYSYCDEDDLYQEAVIYLLEKYRSGRVDGNTDSYLLQGCYFFLKNYIRVLVRKIDRLSVSIYDPVPGRDEETYADILESNRYSQDKDGVEIFLLLDDADARFTKKEKDVFFYRMEGYINREIGDIMGVSHVAVVKTTAKIREKCSTLKEELK